MDIGLFRALKSAGNTGMSVFPALFLRENSAHHDVR